MDIKRLSTEHINACLQIAKKNPEFFNEQGLKDMKRQFSSGLLYGAFNEYSLRGFVHYLEVNATIIEMTYIAVDPNVQGTGIGIQLVNETLKDVSKKYQFCKVKTLAHTHSDQGFAKTRDFYKKLLFHSIEVIDPYPAWDAGNPCEIFIKSLR